MKWPELVPDRICKTEIRVETIDGIAESGAPAKKTVYAGKCNYAEKMRQVLNAERQLVLLQATALFNGDIAPGEDISGYAVIGDKKRRIYAASRGRNPDGTVNFTQLELM